jgi:type III secretory pathway component EscU
MATNIVVQPMSVAIGTFHDRNEQPVYVVLTTEWQRTLDKMVRLLNEQQTTIEELDARVTALGG